MKLLARKLLSVAAPVGLAAALAACGHNTPAMRAVSYPAPVTEASTMPAPAPAPLPMVQVEAVTATVPVPAAEAATPLCDSNGRPLAGNVRTKRPADMCPEPTQ